MTDSVTKSKAATLRNHLLEVAITNALREFLIDNTKDIKAFFLKEEMVTRMALYAKRKIPFDRETNERKVERVVNQYMIKRNKYIKSLDLMGYESFEDNLDPESKKLLDMYMNVINEMMYELTREDEADKEGNTVVITGK